MKHAVIIGASLAGCMCASALADRADEVVVVERDQGVLEPGPRRGVPQGRQLHALWWTGLGAMDEMFPALSHELIDDGAVAGDPGYDFGWWWHGQRRAPVRLGQRGVTMSRPFLEASIRQRALALPNVRLQLGAARGLTATGERVDGVLLAGPGDGAGDPGEREPGDSSPRLPADIVVDCSGRGSQLPAWLADLGYEPPPRREVAMDLGYARRYFRRKPGAKLSDGTMGLAALPSAAENYRVAFILSIEGDSWLVGLAGYAADKPSTDETDFMERCRGKGVPPLTDLLDVAEPTSEIVAYRMPNSLRRDYGALARFPFGLLVAGDAIASFDPIYGQGMTCAAFHARALRSHLASGAGSAAGYFRAVKKTTDSAWALSVGEDFRVPTTRGQRPKGTGLTHRIGDWYAPAMLSQPRLHERFLKVAAMESPPNSLLAPAALMTLARTARANRGPRAGPARSRADAVLDRPEPR
jgi:2-polyprenyl-6-methoxyphenol hydroxylase-like FAD-dependent oxidoreductase